MRQFTCLRTSVRKDVLEAKTGSAVLVARGTPHPCWNPERRRHLLLMTSSVYSLTEDIHALTGRSPEALSTVFAQHDTELAKQWSTVHGR
jgi:hypothetical protein